MSETDHKEVRIPASYKAFTAFTTVACVVLCILLVLAQAANRRLQRSYAEAIAKIGSAGLAVGEQVEPLTVAGIVGGDALPVPAEAFAFDDGRTGTLVLLLSGGCDICKFSVPTFADLARRAEARGIVAVAIQMDAASQEALAYDGSSGFPVAAVREPQKSWLRRVPIVPSIVLLDPRGAVVRGFFGELTKAQQADIEAVLENWTGAPAGPK